LENAHWDFPDSNALGRLVDGDPTTTVTFPVVDAQTVDLLFRLPGDMVAPERFTLLLSSTHSDPRPTEVDLLVSTVSAAVGFSSVRTEKIDNLSTLIDFAFGPVSAQWAMVRLSAGAGSELITVSEIGLFGREGPPESTYAFDQSPAEAIALIQGLQSLETEGIALTDTEANLFALAGSDNLSVTQFEEIALHASGVTFEHDRARFQNQIAEIEVRLRADINVGDKPSITGEVLLDWIHRELLTGGYAEGQTNLSNLLENGAYNCVSSAVIYAALGKRLGLDVRAIEVPDHAFAILYDGADHSDVETTTPLGFNPSRDRQAAFEKLTGYTYIPQANKAKRREIDLAGLAALIYYNHGVFALKDGRYADALIANFRALSLDQEFDSAVKNALAALGRWSFDLADQGKWEAATQAAGVGVSLAPEDKGLAARQAAVWQRWASSLSDNGKKVEAIAILERASAASPNKDFADMQAYLFIKSGEKLIEVGDWTGALAAADSTGYALPDAAKEVLETWQRDLYLRWSGSVLGVGDHTAALVILGEGLKHWPDDTRLIRNIKYIAQEGASAAKTFAGGLAFLTKTIAAFPRLDKIHDVAKAYVARAVMEPTRALDIATGLDMVAQAAPLFDDPEVINGLGALVYERHGHAFIDTANWPAAAEVYAAGRFAYPKERILTRNARFVVQNWQREALDSGGVVALSEVNARLGTLFPDFADSKDFGETEVKRQIAQLLDQGKIAEAQTALDAAQLVLSSDTYKDMSILIIDRNARPSMDAGNWAKAAEVYATGLRLFPGDRHLSNNAVYVAQEWTRQVGAVGGAVALSQTMLRLEDLFPQNAKIAEMGLTTLRRELLSAISERQFDQARQLVATAKPALSPADAENLTVTFFEAMAQTQIKARNWPVALDTYTQGRALYPQARSFSRNVAYIVQEWTAEVFATEGVNGVVKIFPYLQRHVERAKDLDRAMSTLFGRESSALLSAGNPEGALDLVDTASSTMAHETIKDLKVYLYDQWARKTGDGGDWLGAVAIYDTALEVLGNNTTLKNNRRWAASQ
jgi:tetratricopeptide (TPR) repeat protein